MKPRDAWLATQGQLELQLNRATYDTWVRDCRFVAFDDGHFTIGVRNAYVKDWLEQRLYRSIRHTLSGIFRQPVEIEFVVSNASNRRDHRPILEDDGLPLDTVEYDEYLPSQTYPWIDKPQVAVEDNWDSGLNPTYTFETFVVGSSNQMAQAAAQAISRAPGSNYNPLFVYGDVGLGKTHLLHAIGNSCACNGLRVLYATCEQFTNDLVEAIRTKHTADFRDNYRHVDVLMVDDVQFMAGKDATQEEFFHTFNALHDQGKQVVVAADRRSSEIRGLEKRLISRLEWGLQVDIQPPSLEMRLAILRNKSEIQGYRLSDHVVQLLAENSPANVRELEGLLNQVLAYAILMEMPLTVELVERVLAEKHGQLRRPRDRSSVRRRLSVEQVLESTARAFQMSLEDLTGKSRSKDIVQARQWAIYLAREETHASWPEIGGALGGRNHSTILYSYNKVAEQLAANPDFRQRMDSLRRQLHETVM